MAAVNENSDGLLLDRYGTIIVDCGYVGSGEQVQLIDESAEAIVSFNQPGLPVTVVANQTGVARGRTGFAAVAMRFDLILSWVVSDRLEDNGDGPRSRGSPDTGRSRSLPGRVRSELPSLAEAAGQILGTQVSCAVRTG